MNNPSKAIQQIKDLMKQFGFLKEEKFMDVKLVDGNVLKIEGDSIAAGAKVMVVTEEGEVPAPNGEYELEDGTKIIVAEGVIAESMAESEEAPAEENAPEELIDTPEIPGETPVEDPIVEEVAEPIAETILATLLPVLEEIKSLADGMKKVNDELASMKNDFESFKKEPAAKGPIGKAEINNGPSNELDDKVSAIMKLKNKKKN